MRRIAPCATTQYRQWLAPLVATMIISFSPLRQARLAQQQRVVVGEEGAELGRPVREREEDVGHEAGLLLHLEDARAHVVGQVVERGHRDSG